MLIAAGPHEGYGGDKRTGFPSLFFPEALSVGLWTLTTKGKVTLRQSVTFPAELPCHT